MPAAGRRWRVAALSLAVLAGCADEPAREPGREAAEPEANGASPVLPAVYLTELTWVAASGEPEALHLRLRNETTRTRLARRYLGWIAAGDGWAPVLELADTLETPRAAWRPLPSPSFRLRVEEGGDLAGLLLTAPPAVGLEVGERLAEWPGRTGQREHLRPARLTVGAGPPREGLFLTRRRARPSDEAGGETPFQAFLLVSAESEGLLLTRPRMAPAAPATARAWIGGEWNEWNDVTLLSLAEQEGAARWSLQIPDAPLVGELTAVSDSLIRPQGAEVPELRLFRVAGWLLAGDARLDVRGVGLEARDP